MWCTGKEGARVSTVETQLLGKGASVYTVHSGDVVLLEPCAQGLVRIPMRREVAIVLAQHSCHLFWSQPHL